MFTGIVASVGIVESIVPAASADAGGQRLTIYAGSLGLSDVALGDSIAVNGACLTVVAIAGKSFSVDVSRATLDCTVGLDARGEVNLEKALRLGDPLGGHLVSGHVDGVGEVIRFEPRGESWQLVVQASRQLARYLAYKGSVAVNGVSLTVNSVDESPSGVEFSVNLIPHTLANTTLRNLRRGSRVNIEVDQLARYVERMLPFGLRPEPASKKGAEAPLGFEITGSGRE